MPVPNFSNIIGGNWALIRLASGTGAVLFSLRVLVNLDITVVCLHYANTTGLEVQTSRRTKLKFGPWT